MRVTVIGGHGKVALLLQPILIEAGHHVRSLFRNPDHAADVEATGAEPVVADLEALDLTALSELLEGSDAIVWSAGAGGGNPSRTYAVDRDGAIRSMDAAAQAGVERYVMVSYFGARIDHGVPPDNSFFAYAEAKAAADEHLRGSRLKWTILGPSALTMEPGTGLVDIRTDREAGEVPRADVARMVAAVLERPSTIGEFIEFNTGPTPIDEALDRYNDL